MRQPQFAAPVEQLIEYFQRLPGVGRKTAQRFAFYVMGMDEADVAAFSQTLLSAKQGVTRCQSCQNLTDGPLCPVCTDEGRDHATVCVVSEPTDVAAIERAREYKGVYHVLHGVLSPLAHIGPEDLTIRALVLRVGQGDIKEVIMATDPDTTGETTAMYIAGLLKPFDIRVTRLAYGVPVGGHLEFADEVTLLRAIEGRREL